MSKQPLNVAPVFFMAEQRVSAKVTALGKRARVTHTQIHFSPATTVPTLSRFVVNLASNAGLLVATVD